MSPEEVRSDLLVIGSGVAGLSVALGIARSRSDLQVTLISKASLKESNTSLAQGGIAAPIGKRDHPEIHARDTLSVGEGIGDPDVIRLVTGEASERIEELLELGMPLDRNEGGELALAREGGHSLARILHCGDRSGQALHSTLLRALRSCPNVRLLDHAFVLDLLSSDAACSGALVLDPQEGEPVAFTASNSVLATGGLGALYQRTSNSPIATGDGYAMASRLGLTLRDMGKVQFHPTAYALGDLKRAFLISEALRGEGAVLRNIRGEAFAERYDRRGELAPRAVLSRAIAKELERSDAEHVLLDATHFSEPSFRERFPSIHAFLREEGIRPSEEAIPIAPAAHYSCGGVPVDRFGWTGMPGLFACGEVSFTGLHGADRMASNSLLEALVFGERIRVGLMNEPWPSRKSAPIVDELLQVLPSAGREEELKELRNELRCLMSREVGVLADPRSLKRAGEGLDRLRGKMERLAGDRTGPLELETWNMLRTSEAVVEDRARMEEGAEAPRGKDPEQDPGQGAGG